ncbi:hypothetical protein [Noviherbaspirillum humi]|nr:hypothetical protein [Noviherbaspirillum humi]
MMKQVGPGMMRSDYPVQIVMNGVQGGSIEYPSLGCRGVLQFTGMQGRIGVYRERITQQGHVRCIDNGLVTAYAVGAQASIKWENPGIVATAMLAPSTVRIQPAQAAPVPAAPAQSSVAAQAPAAKPARPQTKAEADAELKRRIAEANRPMSIDEAKADLAKKVEFDVKGCSGMLPTKVSRVKLVSGAEFKRLTRGSAVMNAKYLIQYGTVKKKESWSASGPIVSTATAKDFEYMVGRPMCLEDPDVDHD